MAGENKPTHNSGEGLCSLKTTGVFRAINFELYVKPNKAIMVLGLAAITGCIAYLAYMKTNYEKQGLYIAIKEDGTQQLYSKKSRWD